MADQNYFWAIVAAVGGALYLLKRYERKQKERAAIEAKELSEAEKKRLADCRNVITFFSYYYAYIDRSILSPREMEQATEKGASAFDLFDLMLARLNTPKRLVLGYHPEASGRFPVVLPDEYRDKHIYVIGKSGYGKTNFLRYLILQDLDLGSGVGVLAPEHEMLHDELLPHIPPNRIKDVIYFNPKDIEFPVVLNPLHIDSDEDIDLAVDETFTILQRVVGEGGPRMDEILRNSLYALIERPGSTLLDIEPLLDRDIDTFRKDIIQRTQDERVRRFFQQVYPQMPKDAHLPILNRIGRIVRSKYVRNCLCPPTSTTLTPEQVSKRLLNIRRAMDEGKVLLFNLSDGLLGEAASQLIGQLIVSKFQTAIMSRADLAKTDRKPFYLYLDEFQNFCGVASKSYEKMLSRSRKYGLGLILAHQQTGQIPLELMREITGCVSTMVSFQVSRADAARMSKEFINQDELGVESIPEEEFLSLTVGRTYCKIGRNAFRMNIPRVGGFAGKEQSDEVIRQSRATYGIPRIMRTGKSAATSLVDQRTREKPPDPLADLNPEDVF